MLGNSEEPTGKLLVLMKEFSKVTRHRQNMQKAKVAIFTGIHNRKMLPTHNCNIKCIKYPGMNLT